MASTLLEKGLLYYVGYHVGKTGLPKNKQIMLLSNVFKNNLPSIYNLPQEYLIEWGEPKSPQRLKKLAYSIATFCKNAKKKSKHNMDQAIKDWKDDLEWLYNEYYLPLGFKFKWPDTELW